MAPLRTLTYLLLLPLSVVLATPLDNTPRQIGLPCGRNVCTNGQVCCNRSCGVCTKPGDKCLTVICPQVQEDVEVAKREPEESRRQIGSQCGNKAVSQTQPAIDIMTGNRTQRRILDSIMANPRHSDEAVADDFEDKIDAFIRLIMMKPEPNMRTIRDDANDKQFQ
ncbi:hypothetical protein QBC34DRAFT_437849 [Podospora aff. communis PSN243]|uniref:Uncharacterized protein n=1 Tax=Podospora aff. communis PSN243 TaxID=3040156 RepID=A0AAV9GQH7_9PEZI|nr:hypothetical protein QBC34DRAFT_437849 [Podospora aff. communis PSN243]